MKLNSTTFLRVSALILVGIGTYGIYAWQIKEEKVVIKEMGPAIPAPWYYYAIPLVLLLFVGTRILAKHPFKSPATRTLAMFALLSGIGFCGIKTIDSLKADPMFRPTSTVQASPGATYVPPKPVVSQTVVQQQPAPAPIPPPQQEVQEQPSRPQYSYEQCWEIVRRAANDNSVPVPPECRDAQEEFERRERTAEEARRQREREAEEARERQRQEQERIAERQRREEEQRRYEEEENRRRAEAAQRAAEERMERERQERARKIERVVESVLDKVRRRQ